MMADNKLDRLAALVLERTRSGNLAWARNSFRSSAYRIEFEDGAMEIASSRVLEELSLTLYDKAGDIVAVISSGNSPGSWPMLQEIFTLAQGQSQDDWLDKAFSFLESQK